MSHFLNIDDHIESEEIDALNDETFGYDINEINDDWEEEHEKFVGNTNERSSEFIDIGSFIQTIDPTKESLSHKFGQHSFDSNNINDNTSNNKQQHRLSDDLFPNCEDFITKSLLDVVSDDTDFPSDIYSCGFSTDNDTQNGLFQTKSNSSKEKIKDIDLESLRPPSPSVLPFDHTFMSSIWRPLSPESNNNQSNNAYNHSPKDSQKTPEGDTFRSANKIIASKFIRAEDLEANLCNESTNRCSTPNNQNITSNMPPFNQGIEFANLSINQSVVNSLSSSIPIPQTVTTSTKIVQPPPGFGIPNKRPSTIFDAKPVMHSNQITKHTPGTIDSFRPFFNMMHCVPKMSPTIPMPHIISFPSPNVFDPLFQQQRILNKIITPAQAQRSYHRMNNFFNRNQDKFAGFMTQKEKDWLIKIFRLQCKVNDPYVEDYYEVNYMLKKNSFKILAKKQEMINNGQASDIQDNEPLLVVPQLAQVEENKPKYIQFDNALGKIQVLNSKCPRKLVEFNGDEALFENYKLDLRSQYLLKIEHLYEMFLNIEDEDKRMPILPENVIQQHRDRRTQLCNKLFDGLTIKITDIETKDESQFFILINRVMLTLKRISIQVDPEILKINKGLHLVVRSLVQLEDEQHLIVLTRSLLETSCFQLLMDAAQKDGSLDFENIFMKAISRIKSARALVYIISNIDSANIFTNNTFGSNLLISLFKQYELSDDKLLFIYFWTLFVQTLIKQIPEVEESYKISKEHLHYLNQL